jgi:hypothetical protein
LFYNSEPSNGPEMHAVAGEEEFQLVTRKKRGRPGVTLRPNAVGATVRDDLSAALLAPPAGAGLKPLMGLYRTPSTPGLDSLRMSILKRTEELTGLRLTGVLREALAVFLEVALTPNTETPRPCSCVDLVAYGMGTTAFGTNTAVQLSGLLLIRNILEEVAKLKRGDSATACGVRVSCFDPLTTEADRALLHDLDVAVIEENECCRRRARPWCRHSDASAADSEAEAASTAIGGDEGGAGTGRACGSGVIPLVAYMPHCDAPLYDNILYANSAQPSALCLIGNSFAWYRASRGGTDIKTRSAGAAHTTTAGGAGIAATRSKTSERGSSASSEAPSDSVLMAHAARTRVVEPARLRAAMPAGMHAGGATVPDSKLSSAGSGAASALETGKAPAASRGGAGVCDATLEVQLPLKDCDEVIERALTATR